MTLSIFSTTTVWATGDEEWTWTCGECREQGGVYEQPEHATTVARAHLERHELQRQYAPTTAG